MTEKDIRKLIKNLIKKHNTTNPFKLCECLKIKVEREPLGNLKGYYYAHNRIKFIKLNAHTDYDIDKLVCAHELGHAIMHSNLNTMFLCTWTYLPVNKFENEAILFSKILIDLDREYHVC